MKTKAKKKKKFTPKILAPDGQKVFEKLLKATGNMVGVAILISKDGYVSAFSNMRPEIRDEFVIDFAKRLVEREFHES